MNQKLILENWRKFLKEEEKKKQILLEGIDINTIKKVIETLKKYKLNLDITKILPYANKIIEAVKEIVSLDGNQNTQSLKEEKKPILLPLLNKYGLLVAGIAMAIVSMSGAPPEYPSEYIIKMISMGLQNKGVNDFFGSMNGITGAEFATDLFTGLIAEKKKSKSGDRCTRIAKRKYDVWPSAYASGAVVKCRQGKIWKGISENMSDQEIDDALLLEEVEVIEEEWSEKYKRSIDCKNPKGFSQKAHCQGRKLNENTTSNQLEEVAKNVVLYFQGKVPKTILKNTIYFYYTKDEGAKDQVLDILNDPAKRKQYNEYWTKVKTKLEEISKNNNWTVTDDSAWFQMTKPYNTVKNPGNFKYYITFQKGQKFFDNVNKIGKLLTSLNSKKTTGKVSFKIASVFGSAYEHKDSIVIHFNYQQDQQSILEAVKEANFETVDRQKIGRTDLGRDEDTSDSDLIAIKAVETIEQNKNVLLPLLSAEKTSQEYKKGLSGIKHIIDTLMQKSSHRNVTEAKKKDYKPNFSKEKEQGLHGWFARNDGKGWVNCRTGGPCGRDSADKGGKYPACRPTKAQCKSAGKGPLRKKKSSSPISWTKKKKKD